MRPLHAALATVLTLAIAAPAAAAPPTRFFGHPKGDRSAITELQSTSGCVDHHTFVWPVQHTDGFTQADFEITDYDHCTDQILSDQVGISDQPDLTIASDLSSASLHETVPVFDGLDESFPQIGTMTVDLAWVASGPAYRDNVLYNQGRLGMATLVNHDHELCRDAEVSGTIGGASLDPVLQTRICQQIAGSLFLYIEK